MNCCNQAECASLRPWIRDFAAGMGLFENGIFGIFEASRLPLLLLLLLVVTVVQTGIS